MKTTSLRADAARTLFQVLEQGKSLRELLPELQSQHKEQDRAWLQEMLYGVLRQLPLLQYWLRQLLEKPLKSNQKAVEHLIMLGFYQLAFSRVSQHAAVAETVGACQNLKCPGLKGLVNACLRNFIRQNLQQNLPDDKQILSGLPKWLYKKLLQHYPEQLDEISAAMNTKAPIWLRVNTTRISKDDFTAELDKADITYLSEGLPAQALLLTKGMDLTQLPGYQQGWFAAQDGAAQQAAALLAPQKGEHILDACAAPGGKTCHLLEYQPDIHCTAMDCDPGRLQRVEENLLRLGHQAKVVCGDAANPEDWWDGKQYDRILLDAPCSATGVIRRHPDIKWLRKGADIANLAQLQQKILHAIWALLKPGGTLLYATCSILPEENAQQITAFLQCQADARLSPLHEADNIDNPGWQILPGEMQMDGFYYARLIKS
ncbi:16S rRNA (cytosine(967)-C(5))-methyltransferase RsmB [Bowmanella denitrificans]|uniref:16S rRNA (cytosine(967)-C(5))-methyltransferase n=1 Tax=Bowmanella denitrificans TaxID=366582 RepID=A0ABN0XU00_9ALTE